nr:competence type IV pilus minor pilin ComGE [Streptococcus massiliensis]
MALAIFAFIATIVLENIRIMRQNQAITMKREEVLRVAHMALQTQKDTLTLNGITVRVEKSNNQLIVYQGEKEVLYVERR